MPGEYGYYKEIQDENFFISLMPGKLPKMKIREQIIPLKDIKKQEFCLRKLMNFFRKNCRALGIDDITKLRDVFEGSNADTQETDRIYDEVL